MRLLNYISNKATEELGLESVRMERLGQVVAIFGPNGAGKTRLLTSVAQAFSKGISPESLRRTAKNLSTRETSKAQLEERFRKFRETESASRLKQLKQQLAEHDKQIKEMRDNLNFATHCFGEPTPDFSVIPLEGLSPSITTPSDLQTLQKVRVSLYGGEPAPLGANAGEVLQVLANAAFDYHNPQANSEVNGYLHKLYEEACRILEGLLQLELSYGHIAAGTVPLLNGRPVNQTELSQGQKVVLNFVVYLLQQLHRKEPAVPKLRGRRSAPSLQGAIVLIDEPEMHLHPHAVVELIENLRRLVGNDGQLWIATHCTALLPQLKPNEIWVMEKGRVYPPNANQNHRAVESLLGSEEHIERMREFFQTPFRFAANQFAVNSLLSPGTVAYSRDDPQLLQILRAIPAKDNIAILDVGAGTGRLIDAIGDTLDPTRLSTIQYAAVEPNVDTHGEIVQKGCVFNRCEAFENMPSVSNDWSFDVAVLCNVLHEIRPTKWRRTLAEIDQRLKPGGILVLVEDQELPMGELPHDLGYLILTARDIKLLFSLPNDPLVVKHQDERYAKRLLCAVIPKENVSSPVPESIYAAVDNLLSRTRGEIEAMRETANGDGRDGRRYAHLSQMFVNASLALDELKT